MRYSEVVIKGLECHPITGHFEVRQISYCNNVE
jgi:hypothetical protein